MNTMRTAGQAGGSTRLAAVPAKDCETLAEPLPPASAVLEHLGRRFSVGPKYLGLPAPTEADLFQAACIALRAPNHGGLELFRFVQVGTDQRERLGGLFARDAARRGHGVEEIERARLRARNGPALVALIGRIHEEMADVPAHEQWLCIGGGLMNFLNALHLSGFGAKTLSGESLRDPDIQAAFCEEGETLLAWIVAGTPVRSAHAKRTDDTARLLTHWNP